MIHKVNIMKFDKPKQFFYCPDYNVQYNYTSDHLLESRECLLGMSFTEIWYTELMYIDHCSFGDKIHRTDGPAFIDYDAEGNIVSERYYLLNISIFKEEFYTPGFIDLFILENS